MFKSMTAYGRACVQAPIGRFSVELHCVNRKHLEVQTFMPKELLRFDAEVKKWIGAAISRGQINVRINVGFERESPVVISPNLPLARQYKGAWDAIGNDLGIPISDDAFVRAISNDRDLFLIDEEMINEEAYLKPLHDAVHQALIQVSQMKLNEGKILHEDIKHRFQKLSHWIVEIAAKAPNATSKYRERLVEKLQEVMTVDAGLDERILREVCVYAEKIDIAEELTRFSSHLSQVAELIEGKGKQSHHGVGKPLEFLVQELNREINTISSKSSDVDVTRIVIDVKTELERIREQIQNIE